MALIFEWSVILLCHLTISSIFIANYNRCNMSSPYNTGFDCIIWYQKQVHQHWTHAHTRTRKPMPRQSLANARNVRANKPTLAHNKTTLTTATQRRPQRSSPSIIRECCCCCCRCVCVYVNCVCCCFCINICRTNTAPLYYTYFCTQANMRPVHIRAVAKRISSRQTTDAILSVVHK